MLLTHRFMAPPIRAFFDQALPKNTGGHALCIGEAHSVSEALTYLSKHTHHLALLHNVGTLGIEAPIYLNPLIWAYQDKTLEHTYGSADDAQIAFRTLWVERMKELGQNSGVAQANLILNALDRRIRVVAYDARETYGSTPAANTENPPPGVYTTVKNLVATHPEYAARLEQIDRLITQGRARGIGSDALSAALFLASAVPEKNLIAMSGLSHIDGKGAFRHSTEKRIHGTFPDHLKWLSTDRSFPHVTTAILAESAALAALKDSVESPGHHAQPEATLWQYNHGAGRKHGEMTTGLWGKANAALGHYGTAMEQETYQAAHRRTPITLIDLQNEQVLKAAPPAPEKTTPVALRFLDPKHPENTDLIRLRMNPLREPLLRECYNTLRAEWNPGWHPAPSSEITR